MSKTVIKPQNKKIVVLDGYLLNPGDLNWKDLTSLGNCEIYDRTPPELVLKRCHDAEIAITNKVEFTKELIDQLPRLKYIGVTATGYNNIDSQAAKNKGILVTNVPNYSTASVAQHTIALLLSIVNSIDLHNRAVKEGEWSRCLDFCFWKKNPIDLAGLTFGIIGLGAIGKSVARIGQAFGMKVLVNTRIPSSELGFEWADQETLFKNSDIISLHCPLTKETQDVICDRTLKWMKPNTILLNTSRGGLVDENALAKALKEKRIFAAGLDVLKQEPPSPDCPLLHLENCMISPHIGWSSPDSRQRLLSIVIENIQKYLAGAPQNVINI
jgi:glycerate dehydrogenase